MRRAIEMDKYNTIITASMLSYITFFAIAYLDQFGSELKCEENLIH